MELWQSLLVAFGGNAALLLVLGYFGRSLLAQYLSKDIERYKADLESTSRASIAKLEADLKRAAFEYETQFARLQERRAEVVAEAYRLLMVAFREIERFVHPMEWTDQPPKTEIYVTAMTALVEFNRYFDQRRIFLPPEVCDRLEEFSKTLRSPVLILNAYHRIEYPIERVANEKHELWMKEWGKFESEVTAVRVALEAEFRSLLGPRS